MLKMAQQMALAEADLQLQEQHLEQLQLQQQQQQQQQQGREHEHEQEQEQEQDVSTLLRLHASNATIAAAAAAQDMLTPPVLSLLRLVRITQTHLPVSRDQDLLLCTLQQWFTDIAEAADRQQVGVWNMVGPGSALVSDTWHVVAWVLLSCALTFANCRHNFLRLLANILSGQMLVTNHLSLWACKQCWQMIPELCLSELRKLDDEHSTLLWHPSEACFMAPHLTSHIMCAAWHVYCLQVSVQQYNTHKAAGAFLSQLTQLPDQQLQLWWLAKPLKPEKRVVEMDHVKLLADLLWNCCSGFAAMLPFRFGTETTDSDSEGGEDRQVEDGDPVLQLLQWVMEAMSPAATDNQQQHQQQQTSFKQHSGGQGPSDGTHSTQQVQQAQQAQQQQQQQQQQGQAHPAEVLRQVLDVVLTALQYRHSLSMQG
jgi:hypothetical protein